jgi:teichuronic acid biosynthesis glycosyltransferase TuaG
MEKDHELGLSQLVSIVMPCFNASETINESLLSVINQTYTNIEIIVVDDGSTDDSIQLVKQNFPSVFLYQNNTGKKGVSTARNLGISRAKGDWIAFLDADDIWMKEKLEKQINQLNGCRWGHTNSFYFGYNQSGSTKRSDFTELGSGMVFQILLLDNFVTTSTVIAERQLLINSGGFDESFDMLEDWKLWLLLSKSEPLSFCELPLVKYRVTPGSTSRRARIVYPYHQRLITDTFNEGEIKYKKMKRQALSNSNIICSYIAEDGKDSLYAFSCAFRAIYYAPLNLKNWKRPLSILFNILR